MPGLGNVGSGTRPPAASPRAADGGGEDLVERDALDQRAIDVEGGAIPDLAHFDPVPDAVAVEGGPRHRVPEGGVFAVVARVLAEAGDLGDLPADERRAAGVAVGGG